MIKAYIKKLDEVGKELQEHYKAHEGGFILDTETVEGYAVDNVSKLKSDLTDVITKRNELKTKLQVFGDIDPKVAQEAIAQVEKMKTFDPEKEADKIAQEKFQTQFKAKETALTEKHNAELEKITAKAKRASAAVQKALIDSVATQAVVKEKGQVTLLMPHIKNSTRVIENDETGEYDVQVIDTKGNVRLTNKPGSTENMGIGEFVQEMKGKDEFMPAFEGTRQSGGGGGNNPGGGGGAVMEIAASDMAGKSKYANEIAEGTAIVVEG